MPSVSCVSGAIVHTTSEKGGRRRSCSSDPGEHRGHLDHVAAGSRAHDRLALDVLDAVAPAGIDLMQRRRLAVILGADDRPDESDRRQIVGHAGHACHVILARTVGARRVSKSIVSTPQPSLVKYVTFSCSWRSKAGSRSAQREIARDGLQRLEHQVARETHDLRGWIDPRPMLGQDAQRGLAMESGHPPLPACATSSLADRRAGHRSGNGDAGWCAAARCQVAQLS